jgi:RIO-like serine/threonine protein kinase
MSALERVEESRLQVEVGMKNHELVPTQLVASLAKVKGVGIARRLRDLSQHKLLAYERGRNCERMHCAKVF